MLDRRRLLMGGAGVAATAVMASALSARAAPKTAFEVTRTEQEWRRLLTPAQYHILREEGTEPPGSSPLDHFYKKGRYDCVGCGNPLFSSQTKFNSGTGWPSFYQPLDKAVATTQDSTLGMVRTEVHCRRCGGHLGHVFDDGPKPTGLRYCMDGLALKFVPA